MRRFIVGCLALASGLACSGSQDVEDRPSRVDPRIIEDVVYGHKHGLAMVFNVFRPPVPNGLGVVFINSGGWYSPFRPFVGDDGEGGRRLLSRDELNELHPLWGEFFPGPLLEAGYTVFEVRHGSSPKFVIPEVVSDVRRAVRFIRLHAGDYGVAPDRLGVWGGSAGGHLVLMLGLAGEVGDPDPEDEVDRASGRVAAVVSYFPVSDLEEWVVPARLEDHPATGFSPAQYSEYSPINFVSSDDPPTLILHGDQDVLIPLSQGRSVYESLADSGVTAELIVVEGSDHGFQGVDAARAAEATVAWFNQHLRD